MIHDLPVQFASISLDTWGVSRIFRHFVHFRARCTAENTPTGGNNFPQRDDISRNATNIGGKITSALLQLQLIAMSMRVERYACLILIAGIGR